MEFPKLVSIKIEPLDEPIEISVDENDKMGDIIHKLKKICEERGVDLDDWAKTKLGTDKFSFVMVRK